MSEHYPDGASLRDAAHEGAIALAMLRRAALYADVPRWCDLYVQSAVDYAVSAASFYHEAQRLAGECPECGSIFTDPWGGRHYNTSIGCCIEPPEPDYDSAAEIHARRTDPTHPANVELARLKR